MSQFPTATRLLVAMILFASPMGARAQVVEIPSPALENAIRETLDIPERPLNAADMARITDLRVVGQGVSDLGGLEHARNLRTLVIGANAITDLTPLAGLVGLVELHAWNNQIEDLTALAALRSLTALQLGANFIADLGPLSDLTQLVRLDLGANRIESIESLVALGDLRWLNLSGNRIVDVQPLATLGGLHKLWLWRNEIGDISPLAELSELRWLTIGANNLGDISALSDLDRLNQLSVQNNYLQLDDYATDRILERFRLRGTRVYALPQLTSFWASGEGGTGEAEGAVAPPAPAGTNRIAHGATPGEGGGPELVIELEAGQLLELTTSIPVSQGSALAWQSSFEDPAAKWGFRREAQLQIQTSRSDGLAPGPILSLSSWPSLASRNSALESGGLAREFERRSEYWSELRTHRVVMVEDTRMGFYVDRIYRAVFIWLNPEAPDDFSRYRQALAPTVASEGARYLLAGPGQEYESLIDDSSPPDLFWIIEWPSAAAHQRYLASPAFEANHHLFGSGVARFEVFETTLSTSEITAAGS